ncbi:MAG TPA: NAD(P)-binding domain-containing protein [Syntrophales bacterium]|nr:NAD(P)-binding domain-containing protein [Syntrophales bacterium]
MVREKTVGFVGLGMIGSHMAANILKAGYPLAVYNILNKIQNIIVR